MYETEANRKKEAADQISPEIVARFGELKGSSLQRTVLPWSEHCTECVWPTCYSTCDLYTAREDGRCRRFVDGMVRIDCPEALNRYLLKITFKRWGKLWTPGNICLHSANNAFKIERQDYRIGSLLHQLPLSTGIRKVATEKRYSLKKKIAYRQRIGECAPTSFLIECHNPGRDTVRLSLTIHSSDQHNRIPFQQLIELHPGFHRVRVPYQEITKRLDLHSAFNVELIPNNDLHETTLYFGLMDFVHEVSTPDNQGLTGEAKNGSQKIKCIVWDLDNTLWKGVLLEDGPQQLKLKAGVAKILDTLDQRGILHSIASKNNHDEAVATLKAFQIEEYFLYPQISWNPKSRAVEAIARQLNIGIDSVLFVDDSEFELRQVKTALPAVRVLNADRYLEIPEMEPCLVAVTAESQQRRKMYTLEVQRQDVAREFGDDYRSFLLHCGIRLNICPMLPVNLERVHELTQRTNQMNFSGNRYDRDLLKQILATPYLDTYVLDVEDRFGTYGIAGFCIVDSRVPLLTDLMFSCRIQSKRVEHAFLSYILSKYIARTGKDFWANYRETSRNAPAGKVFSDMGMETVENSDGISKLRFVADRNVPDDGIIEICVHDAVSEVV